MSLSGYAEQHIFDTDTRIFASNAVVAVTAVCIFCVTMAYEHISVPLCSATWWQHKVATLDLIQDRGGSPPTDPVSAQQRLKAILQEDRLDTPAPGSQIREGFQVIAFVVYPHD